MLTDLIIPMKQNVENEQRETMVWNKNTREILLM